jgi:voltage-gated potassium channel
MGTELERDEAPRSTVLRGAEAASARHLQVGLGVLAMLIGIGTFGFTWFGSMSWIDGFYMAVTTLSTVGYGEARPLGPGGRLFAALFILVGVGATLYTVAAAAEFLIAGRVRDWIGRRSMNKLLAAMQDHVIVCGYGRLGRSVGAELARGRVDQVIVDEDPAVVARLEGGPHPALLASAADEGILEAAGIARARAIVAATGSEAINVFIALAAREANPTIAIHARAETEAGARRLRRAGATQVVSPYHLGGQRLAHAILRPAVADFMELAAPGTGAEIDLEEVVVPSESSLIGTTLGALGERGIQVSVVAIKREADALALNPTAAMDLRAGDRVVVVGDRENVTRLAELVARPR